MVFAKFKSNGLGSYRNIFPQKSHAVMAQGEKLGDC